MRCSARRDGRTSYNARPHAAHHRAPCGATGGAAPAPQRGRGPGALWPAVPAAAPCWRRRRALAGWQARSGGGRGIVSSIRWEREIERYLRRPAYGPPCHRSRRERSPSRRAGPRGLRRGRGGGGAKWRRPAAPPRSRRRPAAEGATWPRTRRRLAPAAFGFKTDHGLVFGVCALIFRLQGVYVSAS